mgnify:CR=1 FL=1
MTGVQTCALPISSGEARLLCGKPSSEIAALLGYAAEPEMVHRDNLTLLDAP